MKPPVDEDSWGLSDAPPAIGTEPEEPEEPESTLLMGNGSRPPGPLNLPARPPAGKPGADPMRATMNLGRAPRPGAPLAQDALTVRPPGTSHDASTVRPAPVFHDASTARPAPVSHDAMTVRPAAVATEAPRVAPSSAGVTGNKPGRPAARTLMNAMSPFASPQARPPEKKATPKPFEAPVSAGRPAKPAGENTLKRTMVGGMLPVPAATAATTEVPVPDPAPPATAPVAAGRSARPAADPLKHTLVGGTATDAMQPADRSAKRTMIGGMAVPGPAATLTPAPTAVTSAGATPPASMPTPASAAVPSRSGAPDDDDDGGEVTSIGRRDEIRALARSSMADLHAPAKPDDDVDDDAETFVAPRAQIDAALALRAAQPTVPPPSASRANTTGATPVLTVPLPPSTTGSLPALVASLPPASALVSSSPAGTARVRPVLASDVLREDLVPHEPDARGQRIAMGLAGLALLAVAVSNPSDVAQMAAWAIPGLTAIVMALAPLSYATRALLAFAPTLPALVTQSLAMPGVRWGTALLFAMVATGLPLSLLFRANFRAARRARLFVATALLAAVAWLFAPGGGGLLAPGAGSAAWTLTHLPALLLAGTSLLSLLAFMGMNTSAGCRTWAGFAVVWAGVTAFFAHAAAHGLRAGLSGPPMLAAVSVSALTAVIAVSGAALAAVYLRPNEPRTGIGAAA